jgi:hypothetical protein
VIVREVAASGSNANQTTPAVEVRDPNEGVGFLFEVEGIGAAPTVTYKWQGSLQGANWFDIAYITDASAVEAVAAKTKVAVGADVLFLALPQSRIYRYYRLVVSAINNVTYKATIVSPESSD